MQRLGPLTEALVAIADDDLYPGGTETSGWAMIKAFLQEQVAERGVKFFKTAAALGYIGMFSTIDALILKLVIDNALGKADDGSSGSQKDPTLALWLAVAYFFAFALYHRCDVMQLDFRGRSGTRKWLRNSLVMRFLNMSETSQHGLSDGDFLNCTFFQVEQLVGDGWYSFLLMIRYAVQILTNLAFQLWIISLSSSESLPTWPIFIIFLILLPVSALILYFREEAELILIRERQHAEDRWVHAVNDMVASRHIIIAYDCVEKIGAEFKKMYDDFYNKHRASRFYQQTSQWIPSWLLASILFLAYAFAPALVDAFDISAGDFAAIIKSWLKLKSGVEAFYKCMLKLQRSIVGLEKIADVLNRKTVYEERLAFMDKQKFEDQQAQRKLQDEAEAGDQSGLEAFSKKVGSLDPFDARREWQTMPAVTETLTLSHLDFIRLEDVTFEYKRHEDAKDGQQDHWGASLNHASVVIPTSGNLVLVCNDADASHPGESKKWSKRTLLRLMAGILYPQAGRLTMPPHKRCVLLDRKVSSLSLLLTF